MPTITKERHWSETVYGSERRCYQNAKGEQFYYDDDRDSWNRFDVLDVTDAGDAIRESDADTMWRLIARAATFTRRVLLYGPPGTGKSFLARHAGVNGHGVYPVPVHSDLPAAELRGHFIPVETGGLKWMDGPAISAWRHGGRLVLDEIDKAGDDSLSFLLAILDDHPTASMVLGTTNETITPSVDFSCWATMNGELEDLPPALLDRFPVCVRITGPNPDAIAALPEDLRKIASELTVSPDRDRRVGLRAFVEFANLREHLGEDDAARLIFPDKWDFLKPAIRLGKHADPR